MEGKISALTLLCLGELILEEIFVSVFAPELPHLFAHLHNRPVNAGDLYLRFVIKLPLSNNNNNNKTKYKTKNYNINKLLFRNKGNYLNRLH